MSRNKTALVLGATGLVGRALIQQLLVDPRYDAITLLIRKPLPSRLFVDPLKKLVPIVIDFAHFQDYQGYFGVNHVYCCLGTTPGQAGSKAAFRQVEFEYIHVAAQLTRAQRADSFVWISSVGANAKSSNFYLKVKGELENALMRMPQLHNASAVRPSLLLDERADLRPLEYIAKKFAPVWSRAMRGPLAKYKPVRAAEVARKMMSLQVF
ncbi:NAD(P)H-binding protein [Aestuariibacter sp. A3R04]|uniref:NAD(P)H-binding protein n=1 Tax=Aestuariibacter sp. A3R04 TaxID=2841571 RepID=UPI001C0A66FC|nr:epimerase [Aestuariibacter sp. A3R04]